MYTLINTPPCAAMIYLPLGVHSVWVENKAGVGLSAGTSCTRAFSLLMELTHETKHLYMHRMMYVKAYILFVVESVHCNVIACVERLTHQASVIFTVISPQQYYWLVLQIIGILFK